MHTAAHMLSTCELRHTYVADTQYIQKESQECGEVTAGFTPQIHHTYTIVMQWLCQSPCKPLVPSSIPGFSIQAVGQDYKSNSRLHMTLGDVRTLINSQV